MSEVSKPTWTTRPAKPEEQGDLTRLAVRATRHIGYDDAFIDRIMPSLTITLPLITGDGVLVAEDSDGKVCGVVAAMPSMPGFSHLHGIFVEPTARRQGVGRALLEAAVARLRGMQAGAMVIYAEPSAVGFYERLGAISVADTPFMLSPEVTLRAMLYVFPAQPTEAAATTAS